MSNASVARRPWPLLVAAGGTAAAALLTLVLAALSLTGGHGIFSAGVSVMLVIWGAAALAAARGLWSRRVWARGPATMIALVHAFGFGEFALNDQPLAWAAVGLAGATLVSLVLPATTRALGFEHV